MRLFERLAAFIAPHDCLACGTEGGLLCRGCAAASCPALPPRCYACGHLDPGGRTCKACRGGSALYQVWTATAYDGLAKKLIYKMKFDGARAACAVAAGLLASRMSHRLPANTFVCHAPTVPFRIRRRGFDQAELMARRVAAERGLPYRSLLIRTNEARQVGAGKRTRKQQMRGAFVCRGGSLKGVNVIVVDDILTTGATLEAAAAALKAAGARRVSAAVFARAL